MQFISEPELTQQKTGRATAALSLPNSLYTKGKSHIFPVSY